MRIRLDPWPVDTQNAQLTLKPFAGRVYDVESPRWEAVAACPLPESLRQVLVVDGRPRMDARLLLEDDAGRLSVAGFGAYAVGAVDLCPHGHRQARFHGVDMQRVMAFGGDLQLSAERLSPRNPQTGELIYQPQSFSGTDILGAQAAIQKRMLDTERALAQAWPRPCHWRRTTPTKPPKHWCCKTAPCGWEKRAGPWWATSRACTPIT
ncbi:hypothetical protein [Deinococcus radiophilus]|uniref:hypothetical protein n=1 Tax=Deinococcus radiophilus TaxID=32062 RepID=UPI0036068710